MNIYTQNQVFNIIKLVIYTLYIKTFSTNLHSKKMLGCFNPILGQTWTNPNVGFKKMQLINLTQQNWVKTTQHFLECIFNIFCLVQTYASM